MKTITGIMLTLLLTSMLTWAFNIHPAKAEPTTIYVDDDNVAGPWDGTQEHPYQNITSGIEHAVAGDTIFVYNGTYLENVVVNKDNLTLIGENREATIINDGMSITANNDTVNSFTINGVINLKAPFPYSTSGNNVTNNVINGGIELYDAHSCLIAGNNISTNGQRHGIDVSFSSGIIITSNHIINCWPYEGIDMFASGGNAIEKNYISDNSEGIVLFGSTTGNVIVKNIVANNAFSGISLESGADRNLLEENLIVTNPVTKGPATYYGHCIELWNANDNTLYHNNIIQNISGYAPVYISWLDGGTNFWDDGYPSGGNYWSDYSGVDSCSGLYQNETGSDGMGDTFYTIDANNTDRYPLMAPWSPLPIKMFDVVWEDVHYPVATLSNSTITHFIFNQTQAQISFNVTGLSGAGGYCNVIIPKNLLRDDPWTVTIDGVPKTDFTQSTNDTHTFLYFTYTHASTSHIVIKGTWVVPEFPIATILPLFMVLAILAVIFAKKKIFQKTQKLT